MRGSGERGRRALQKRARAERERGKGGKESKRGAAKRESEASIIS